MIKITPDQTTLQANLYKIDAPIKRIEKRIAACINDLNESFQAFWSLPDDQINEALKYHGIQRTQSIFGAHNDNGEAFNKLLEDRGISSPRAILVAPKSLEVMDGNLRVVPLAASVSFAQDGGAEIVYTAPVIEKEIIEDAESQNSDFPN